MEHYSSKAACWIALAAVFAMAFTVAPCAAQNSPQDFVAAHNAARTEVGLGPVSWDETVAAWAQNYAAQRQGDCALMHSPAGRPYGENLFWGGGSSWTAADAVVGSWVAEKQYYDHASNTCSAPAGKSCGHYTQIVWRESTAIGCARVVCNNGNTFIICSYSPPGNMPGRSPY